MLSAERQLVLLGIKTIIRLWIDVLLKRQSNQPDWPKWPEAVGVLPICARQQEGKGRAAFQFQLGRVIPVIAALVISDRNLTYYFLPSGFSPQHTHQCTASTHTVMSFVFIFKGKKMDSFQHSDGNICKLFSFIGAFDCLL